jgi:nitrogen fixation NifU-like protein
MAQDKLQGGSMGGVDDLYREVILDHFKAPKNKGVLAEANAKADGMNPLCGDQISITASVKNGILEDLKFEGHGCAISQSAASMLTQGLKGKTLEDVLQFAQAYKIMFGVHDKKETSPNKFQLDDLGDLVSLEGVKKYPVRIKCAVLSVNTVLQALEQFFKK